MTHYRNAAGEYLGQRNVPPDGGIACPPYPGDGAVWLGEAWSAPPDLPATDTPLTARQWHYGLRVFGLCGPVEAFVATLEGADLEAAAQFESAAIHANRFAFADVLALLAAYRDAPGFPAALDLTEAQLAAMWAQVLDAIPGER